MAIFQDKLIVENEVYRFNHFQQLTLDYTIVLEEPHRINDMVLLGGQILVYGHMSNHKISVICLVDGSFVFETKFVLKTNGAFSVRFPIYKMKVSKNRADQFFCCLNNKELKRITVNKDLIKQGGPFPNETLFWSAHQNIVDYQQIDEINLLVLTNQKMIIVDQFTGEAHISLRCLPEP